MTNPADRLGRLERVTIRDVWADEARDFTPWLAREENIALLGETIGLELEVEAQEHNVGPFRADILCKELTDDHWVLIENRESTGAIMNLLRVGAPSCYLSRHFGRISPAIAGQIGRSRQTSRQNGGIAPIG